MTNFVTEAVGAQCSRCEATAFMLGEARKPLADKLRDDLWRAVGGALVCYECLASAVVGAVVAGVRLRFRLEGHGYELASLKGKSGGHYSGEARRTDGGGGSRLVVLNAEVLDSILTNWEA